MNKPFLYLVLSYIIGILMVNNFHIGFSYLLMGLSLGIITLIFSILRNRTSLFSILIIFVFLGMIITTLKADSKILKYTDRRMDYVGIIEETMGSDEDMSRYIVNVEGFNERIRLNVIGGDPLKYGERFIFDGEIREPLGNTNPMLYNHRLNLLSNNIYATMTINDYSIERQNTAIDFKYRIKESFHKNVNRTFDTYLIEGNRDIIKSIILGDSSYMLEEEVQEYRELGLGHILAVSGLHIGIISWFILSILMKLSISRKYSSLITIGIILLYGFLIGFPHSMVRGIIMFSLLILTKLLYEHSNSINILSLSALIVLLINPFTLYGLGFILSYTAVLSLFLLSKRIEILLYPYKGYIAKTISAVLAVNIGLLPVQAYYFNYISILGIIANLIIIPILSLALILSVIMYILNFTLPFINIGIAILLNFILNIEGLFKDIIYEFSSLIFTVPSPRLPTIIFYYILVALALKLIKVEAFKPSIQKSIMIFLNLVLIVSIIGISLDKPMELHFIDVGQGDSLLIRDRGKNILIDTGGSLLNNYVGEHITLPYLQKLGTSKLDAVIITHFDADHYGALPILIDKIEIGTIYGSYLPEDKNLYNKIMDNKLNFKLLKEGDLLRLNDEIFFNVLWPRNTESLSNNNKSLVVLLSYNDYKILLTGDIEREAEQNLLGAIPKDVDILKVAHHGSKTSSNKEFLSKVKPRYSIISSGRNNQFNHPNQEVVKNLMDIESTIYRTDEMGLIKVELDKDIIINPFLEKGSRSVVELIYENSLNIVFCLIYYIVGKKLIITYIRSGAEIYELP